MLATDPAERVSASEALEMMRPALNGAIEFPPMGSLLPIGLEPEAAEHNKAKRARREVEDGPSVASLCSKLGTQSPQTATAAQEYYRRSEAARTEGLNGRAACALLACKMHEPETWMPHDLCEVPELADFDTDGYPELELAVLRDLGFCLVFPPAAGENALKERN